MVSEGMDVPGYRVGFESATLRTQGTDPNTESPRPKTQAQLL